LATEITMPSRTEIPDLLPGGLDRCAGRSDDSPAAM
jgi:hypothetical protein